MARTDKLAFLVHFIERGRTYGLVRGVTQLHAALVDYFIRTHPAPSYRLMTPAGYSGTAIGAFFCA